MHAGKGIDFGTEDEGNLVEKYVADDAATSPRQCPHDDGYPHRLACAEGLLDTNDGKHAEAEGVEEKPRVVASYNVLLEAPHEKQGEGGDVEVDGVLRPENGHIEHHIAQGATANGRGETYDVGSEKVETLSRSKSDARNSEGKGAYVIKSNDEVVIERQYLLFQWSGVLL